MKREAYEESTIKATAKRLEHLERNCTLENPEVIETYITNKQCSNAYKECLIESYAIFMRSIRQTWQQPFYNRYDKLPKVPTEEKIIDASARYLQYLIVIHKSIICRAESIIKVN